MSRRRRLVLALLVSASLFFAGCRQDEAPGGAAVAPTTSESARPLVEPPLAVATPPPIRLRAGELLLAADRDDFPAIFADDTLFVSAASSEWPDDELIIGVMINDHARAYPTRLLSSYEIVNDVIGGEPVAVTWCPLCFSAIVFSRLVDGRELTFGVSGLLYRNNLVMYDHQSNSEWSQAAGEAIRGAQRGARLDVRPSFLLSWAAWRELHPDAEILSAAALGQRADAVIDQYGSYYSSGTAGITDPEHRDDRLDPQALVVGFSAGGISRAYPLAAIRAAGIINDTVGDLPLLLLAAPDGQSVAVFQRTVNGQAAEFTWGPDDYTIVDSATGSTWDWRTGAAVAGPATGRSLLRLAGPLIYWFAWIDFHPGSELYPSPAG